MRNLRLIGLFAFLCLAAQAPRLVSSAAAKESMDAFIEAAWQRGMYEEVAIYLEQLQADPALPAELKPVVEYHLAMNAVESADATTDAAAKAKKLDAGIKQLKAYIARSAGSDLAAGANRRLGSALLDYARAQAALEKPADGGAAAGGLTDETRKHFDEAREHFAAAEQQLAAELKKIPKLLGPEDVELRARQDKLAGELAQVQLLSANVNYERAGAAGRGSPEAQSGFKASAAEYAKLYETYRTFGAGLYAHFWEGRCYQELGDLKRAIGCYLELMDLPDTRDGRALKANLRMQSLRRALECWTDPGVKDYAQAREHGEEWIKNATGVDAKDPEALAIRYLTALATWQEIAGLPAKDANRKKLATTARGFLAPVVKQPGEFQQSARTLLGDLGGKQLDDVEESTFAEAQHAGKESLARMQAAARALKENPKGDPALAKQVEEDRAESIAHFHHALALADQTTTTEDVNLARYILCYLYWDGGEYHDSAVLGGFLAQHYAETDQGREGAKIALASYVKLYSDPSFSDKQFEISQVERWAAFIVARWPKEQAGQDAAQTLMAFAVQQRDYKRAMSLVAKIPVDSPARGQAELKIGQSLWAAYLRDSQSNETAHDPAAEHLKVQAQQILQQGIDRMQAEPKISQTLATAVLSLAQISLDTAGPQKAIALLEDQRLGPLVLLKKKDPATAREGFAVETYKAALRAYVAAKEPKKAEEIMDALEKAVSNNEKAADTLTAIYISMGHDLQQQLQELRKSGKSEDLDTVSQSFEAFLTRIATRQKGISFSTLNWVAETFISLGGGYDDGGASLSPKAKSYYDQAAKTYQRILADAEAKPGFAPNAESLIGVRLRLANCWRKLGNYNDSVKLIANVLVRRPNMLVAQIQAADTFQAWGTTNSMGYVRAIKGAHPDKSGKFVIWGWMKIAQTTLENPKFEAEFFQARLKQAECHYLYGLQHKDEAGEASLNLGKQDIGSTYRYRPDLGGSDRFREFEQLLKKIQEALKEKPIGLQEFKIQKPASASAQASK